jgi:CheY-like chemotaxis protein
MPKFPDSVVILMADDDPDDRLMAREAWQEAHFKNQLRFVEDGQELLDYLCRRGDYAEPGAAPRPGLILLDLNMPRLDGQEALRRIKANPDLRTFPVVILTTSSSEEDILRTYVLGSKSFITKPVAFDGLVEVVKSLGTYWLEIVRLPKAESV